VSLDKLPTTFNGVEAIQKQLNNLSAKAALCCQGKNSEIVYDNIKIPSCSIEIAPDNILGDYNSNGTLCNFLHLEVCLF